MPSKFVGPDLHLLGSLTTNAKKKLKKKKVKLKLKKLKIKLKQIKIESIEIKKK